MAIVAKGGQIFLAGAGFLTGYGWTVSRWAERVGMSGGAGVMKTLLSTGLALAFGYALLLTALFWSCLPSTKGAGLRIVVAPTAFSVSALLGAMGMEAALRLVG
jgi:hypothetical protein